MSAPVEVLLSELQSRILVEVYLAHGPVDIFRLWSEMFERQKSISSGMLLFTRAIVQLEDEGYLQKVAEMNSTLAPKGEMYLIGAVLSGELPEGCWEKLSSTQNILDVAPQGGTGVSGGERRAAIIPLIVAEMERRENISKLPDISLSRQHELEEIEAEREGGDTAASGYQEPGSHPSFA